MGATADKIAGKIGSQLKSQSHETLGTCIQRIGPLIDMPLWLLDVIGLMQRSAMGVHVHCGTEGRFVRLRALGLTGDKALPFARRLYGPGWRTVVRPPAASCERPV